MIEKLAQLERTHSELSQRLADPALLADHKAYADTNRALSEIRHVVSLRSCSPASAGTTSCSPSPTRSAKSCSGASSVSKRSCAAS